MVEVSERRKDRILNVVNLAVDLLEQASQISGAESEVTSDEIWISLHGVTMDSVSADIWLKGDGRFEARAYCDLSDEHRSEFLTITNVVEQFLTDHTDAEVMAAAPAIRADLEAALALLPPT